METFSALLAFCAGNSPVTGALMFSLIRAWINYWVNNAEAGDLRRHHTHYDVTVIILLQFNHRNNILDPEQHNRSVLNPSKTEILQRSSMALFVFNTAVTFKKFLYHDNSAKAILILDCKMSDELS